MPSDADAFVVGSGPRGASGRRDARRRGLKVVVIEGAATSGGLQNEELTLPGIWHDVGSAAHPLAVASPPLPRFSLGARGLVRIPGGGVRAPVGWGPSRLVTRSVAGMAARSAVTRGSYRRLMQPLAAGGTTVTDLLLSAMRRPQGRCFPGLAVLARYRLRSAAGRARRFRSPKCGRWSPAPPRTR